MFATSFIVHFKKALYLFKSRTKYHSAPTILKAFHHFVTGFYALKIKYALIVIGILLTGCVVQVNTAATKSTPTKTAITQTLAYNQKIHWHPCKGHKNFLCSSISVPLSYSDPSKGLINIPILIHKAKIKSKGTIFFNFGGPGVPSFKFFSCRL